MLFREKSTTALTGSSEADNQHSARLRDRRKVGERANASTKDLLEKKESARSTCQPSEQENTLPLGQVDYAHLESAPGKEY